jgi:hypothetical protein
MEDERKAITFCVGGSKDGVEEMVRKLECPVHTQLGYGKARGKRK